MLKKPNIAATLIAFGMVAILLMAAAIGDNPWNATTFMCWRPSFFRGTNEGISLQRMAFDQTDLLPLYGSSELVKPAGNKAADFFYTYRYEF